MRTSTIRPTINAAAAAAAGAQAVRRMESSGSEPWKLIYWPGIKGRGEYVRLIFEAAGVPYEDLGASLGRNKPGGGGSEGSQQQGGSQHFDNEEWHAAVSIPPPA